MGVLEDLQIFYDNYNGEKFILGKTILNKPIYCFFIGTHGNKEIISTYSIHAREWITCYLALDHIKNGLVEGGVYIIPCVNPDGVEIATNGTKNLSKTRADFIKKISSNFDLSLWKANANGVDLNVNFDAKWGEGRQNVFSPSPSNYVGLKPFCERESSLLRDFTLQLKPKSTISFHSKGEEIYYEFNQNSRDLKRDEEIAILLAKSNGYFLKKIKGSVGGYKDWCIQKLKIPSFTIEIGNDRLSHPITLKNYKDIKEKNIDILNVLIRSV